MNKLKQSLSGYQATSTSSEVDTSLHANSCLLIEISRVSLIKMMEPSSYITDFTKKAVLPPYGWILGGNKLFYYLSHHPT